MPCLAHKMLIQMRIIEKICAVTPVKYIHLCIYIQVDTHARVHSLLHGHILIAHTYIIKSRHYSASLVPSLSPPRARTKTGGEKGGESLEYFITWVT